MKKTDWQALLILLFLTIALTSCGGGGDVQPSSALITLSTTGPLATGTKIGGVEAVIHLPRGATAKAGLASPNPSMTITDPGVVAPAGDAVGAEYALATYQTSTVTATGDMDVYIAKSSGFDSGDFAVVTCDISPGHSPTAADFTLGDFSIKDLNGADVVGLTVVIKILIQ